MSAFRMIGQSVLCIPVSVTLFGCVSPSRSAALTPADAGRLVAVRHGEITGVFRLESKSFRLGEGPEQGAVYLFSAPDFRFPGCLTVFITARAVKALQAAGQEAPFAFSGKLIEVKGTAKRVRARASNAALEADKLYDRTQINVDSTSQIRILCSP